MEQPIKICSTCKQVLPLSDYHKKKKAKDGLNWQCKRCVRKHSIDYYQKHQESIKQKRREYYQENIEVELDYASEYRGKHKEENREYARKRRQEQPNKVKEINRASYARNRERRVERARKYREENTGKVAESKASSYIKHREKNLKYAKGYRKQYSDYQRIYRSTRVGYWREWQESHPDQRRANQHNYRVRKLGAEGKYTEEDIKIIYDKQKGLCFYCGSTLENVNYHHDHMIPLSRGGSNWPDNIAISCVTCNLSKHDKTAEEYIEWRKKNGG